MRSLPFHLGLRLITDIPRRRVLYSVVCLIEMYERTAVISDSRTLGLAIPLHATSCMKTGATLQVQNKCINIYMYISYNFYSYMYSPQHTSLNTFGYIVCMYKYKYKYIHTVGCLDSCISFQFLLCTTSHCFRMVTPHFMCFPEPGSRDLFIWIQMSKSCCITKIQYPLFTYGFCF